MPLVNPILQLGTWQVCAKCCEYQLLQSLFILTMPLAAEMELRAPQRCQDLRYPQYHHDQRSSSLVVQKRGSWIPQQGFPKRKAKHCGPKTYLPFLPSREGQRLHLISETVHLRKGNIIATPRHRCHLLYRHDHHDSQVCHPHPLVIERHDPLIQGLLRAWPLLQARRVVFHLLYLFDAQPLHLIVRLRRYLLRLVAQPWRVQP